MISRTILSMAMPASAGACVLIFPHPAFGQGSSPAPGREIVVTATPDQQQAAIDAIEPERTYEPEQLGGYGAETVGDLINAISAEQGDEEPALFVNGVPITDPGDISDYPAGAALRIEVLPRSAAARLGAAASKRAYNVVLRKSFAATTATGNSRVATEGGWKAFGGEIGFTRIAGQKRLNLTVRGRKEDSLLEADRAIVQPPARFPYALGGNVIGDPAQGTAEIDPALSALAGRVVDVAAIPMSGRTLADFARMAGQMAAGQVESTDLGNFRTLRPETRALEASINHNRPLASWLGANLTARIEGARYRGLQGLRSGLFVVPADPAYSPFSGPVGVARYYADDPLENRTAFLRGNIGGALNATAGKWQISLRGDYRYNRFTSTSLRQAGTTFAPITLDPASGIDPFSEATAALIPLVIDRSRSVNRNASAQLSATGPLLALPAGALRLNFNASLRHVRQTSQSSGTFVIDRDFARDEQQVQAAIEIPLLSREAGPLRRLGDLGLTLDYGLTDVNRLGTVRREGGAINWRPVQAVMLQASHYREGLLPDVQQLGDPVSVIEGVRYLDLLTGQTVDVTQIYGGNAGLRRESVVTRRYSATAQLARRIGLQVNGEYVRTVRNDPISSLPAQSVEFYTAFPDRFVRGPDGRLVLVDLRPVNFANRETEQLRWGLSFDVPLYRIAAVQAGGAPVAAGPRPRRRVQFSLSHIWNLTDSVLPVAGRPAIDLLQGAAVGFAGGGTPHMVEASAGFSDRQAGVRLSGVWRSEGALNFGTGTRLRLAPIATFNLKAFADLGQIVPGQAWLKRLRGSINVVNLLGNRQQVRDASGMTPLRYQPGYRDPLGRTVEVELRATF